MTGDGRWQKGKHEFRAASECIVISLDDHAMSTSPCHCFALHCSFTIFCAQIHGSFAAASAAVALIRSPTSVMSNLLRPRGNQSGNGNDPKDSVELQAYQSSDLAPV